jgi:hypothetical protein
MELLKTNLIIDQKYKPSLELSYLDYFNRAMVFAQTNYQDELDKVAKTQFSKISPTRFFEEYVWAICCLKSSIEDSSRIFLKLSKELKPYYNSFWDLTSFPKSEELKNTLSDILENQDKVNAIINTASIINKGIKLYGWEFYRSNFLDASAKLTALPMLGIMGARQLSRGTGSSQEVVGNVRLHKLATHWNFEDSRALCEGIQKYVPMQLKIIELILWYTVFTFSR